jgi:hypothetical protein
LRRGHEPGRFIGVNFGGAQAQISFEFGAFSFPSRNFPCGIARPDYNLAYYYIT